MKLSTHKYQKTKKSIYQLVYKRKKSNDENSNSISKSKVQVTINNNIIIRPKINISFINRVDSKSKEKIHLSQKKKRIIQSRNGKFNVHYVNLNSTIGYGNKTFNYGINEDIIKNTNNSKCIKYTVNPNKKQKKPNNTNNLKALYQKRKNNTKLSYDFEHFFKNFFLFFRKRIYLIKSVILKCIICFDSFILFRQFFHLLFLQHKWNYMDVIINKIFLDIFPK